jgi:hypothetical protein
MTCSLAPVQQTADQSEATRLFRTSMAERAAVEAGAALYAMAGRAAGSTRREGKFLHDAFINSVKEADFIRNGTAKGIMSLSKDDSTQLWKAVVDRECIMVNISRSTYSIVRR